MKIVISPAKSLDFESKLPVDKNSEAIFLSEAEKISNILKTKSPKALSKLMGISNNLAELNWQRNQDWSLPFTEKNSRPAAYAFSGDVYRGLDAYTIPKNKVDSLQNTLRILSGQYGILKPLDLMQPYRLEMGTKLPIGENKNLYELWKKKIVKSLNDELKENELFVNLASNEYFKAVDVKSLKVPVITPVFKNLKNGEYKIIAIYAKLARGLMTRYVIDNNISSIEGLKGFNYENYSFSNDLSKDNELVFIR